MNSQMQIEVVNVNVSTQPTAKGSYQIADVAYKNKSFQDKLEGKKVMSFANKDVFDTLTKAQFGEVYTITRVKNDKGYWDWTAANADSADGMVAGPVSAAPAANTAVAPRNVATPAPKSNYETAEERAARQVMIVRQSSLSNAVNMFQHDKFKKFDLTANDVIGIAKDFENYVFGRSTTVEEPVSDTPEPPKGIFADLDDDLPY